MNQRLIFGLLFGAILGVVCIVGAQIRSDFTQETWYLFAFWYNRIILGLLIGVLSPVPFKKALIRGALIGLIVSFAFYSSTNFSDLTGFLAGIIYGVIIEAGLYYLNQKKLNS